MIFDTIKSDGVDIKLWLPVHEVESSALTQLKNVASVPGVIHHLAVMPDVHTGVGATIGTVIATTNILIPAAVGVDIGCGMIAVGTSYKRKDLPNDTTSMRETIEAAVPVGFNSHRSPVHTRKDVPINRVVPILLEQFPEVGKKELKEIATLQLGTLGGGNHFIELSLDENDFVWIVIHSGSRNVGKTIADHHLGIAKDLCREKKLSDHNLSYLKADSAEGKEYWDHARWAQRYAGINRCLMLELVAGALRKCAGKEFLQTTLVSCHHNFVSTEEHYGKSCFITRKGAIGFTESQMGIIPGSMGTRSYIVRGLNNQESFCSASHGAGRAMSRGEAKRRFSLDDLRKQTEGIECRKDHGILDELPAAYKDINVVMKRQEDLVETEHELRQFVCIKG